MTPPPSESGQPLLVGEAPSRHSVMLRRVAFGLFVIAAGGTLVPLVLGNTLLATSSLLLTAPIAAAAVLMAWHPTASATHDVRPWNVPDRLWSFTYCLLVGAALLTFQMASSRSLLFFVFLALAYVLIAAEVLFRRGTHRWTTIVKSWVLAALAILSHNLHSPFYYGFTDLFTHTQFVQGIVETAQVDAVPIAAYYRYHPGYGVLIASVVHATGLEVHHALFLTFAILALLALIGIQLFAFRIGLPERVAVLTTVLLSCAMNFVFNTTYAVPRVMTLLLFPMLLASAASRRAPGAVAAAIMALTLVFFHSVSAGQILLLLIAGWLAFRALGASVKEGQALRPYLIVILAVAVVADWVLLSVSVVDYARNAIALLFSSTTDESQLITGLFAKTPLERGIEFVVDNLYYCVAAFLATISGLWLISQGMRWRARRVVWMRVCLALLVISYPLYFPVLEAIPGVSLLQLWRWRLYAEVLIVPLLALGIAILAVRGRGAWAPIAVGFLALLSLASPFNAPDNDALESLGVQTTRDYLLSSEVSCLLAAGSNSSNSVFSDHVAARFLRSLDFDAYPGAIDAVQRQFVIPQGAGFALRVPLVEQEGIELYGIAGRSYGFVRVVMPVEDAAQQLEGMPRSMDFGSCLYFSPGVPSGSSLPLANTSNQSAALRSQV